MTGVACVFFFRARRARPGRSLDAIEVIWKNGKTMEKSQESQTHTRTRLFLIINQKDICVCICIYMSLDLDSVLQATNSYNFQQLMIHP